MNKQSKRHMQTMIAFGLTAGMVLHHAGVNAVVFADNITEEDPVVNSKGFFDMGYVAPSVHDIAGYTSRDTMPSLKAAYVPASYDSRNYGYVMPVFAGNAEGAGAGVGGVVIWRKRSMCCQQ